MRAECVSEIVGSVLGNPLTFERGQDQRAGIALVRFRSWLPSWSRYSDGLVARVSRFFVKVGIRPVFGEFRSRLAGDGVSFHGPVPVPPFGFGIIGRHERQQRTDQGDGTEARQAEDRRFSRHIGPVGSSARGCEASATTSIRRNVSVERQRSVTAVARRRQVGIHIY